MAEATQRDRVRIRSSAQDAIEHRKADGRTRRNRDAVMDGHYRFVALVAPSTLPRVHGVNVVLMMARAFCPRAETRSEQ